MRTPTTCRPFTYTTLFRSAEAASGKEAVALIDRERPDLAMLDLQMPEIRTLLVDEREDRKSTRLNSSHLGNSYAVFCMKKKIIDSSKKSNYVDKVMTAPSK